jgi:hypothetical protein
MTSQFLANDGEHRVRLIGDDKGGFTEIIIEPALNPGESVTFFSNLPEAPLEFAIPEHVTQEAFNRGLRVCGYNPHCQTCFCDDEGNKTCVGIC